MDQTTANGYCTLRSLMRVYHRARKVAPVVERKRLNRALGIAMRARTVQATPGKWKTPASHYGNQLMTLSSCTCRDRRHGPELYCKHILAVMLIVRARQLDEEVASGSTGHVSVVGAGGG